MSLQLNLKTIDDALGQQRSALLIVAARDEAAFIESLRMQWPGYPLLPGRIPADARFAGVRVVVVDIQRTSIVDMNGLIRPVFTI